jgi:hypothetical protein
VIELPDELGCAPYPSLCDSGWAPSVAGYGHSVPAPGSRSPQTDVEWLEPESPETHDVRRDDDDDHGEPRYGMMMIE